MLLGELQSTAASDSLCRTIYVSCGLRPLDSGGVQVASAPLAATNASLLATAPAMSSLRVRLSSTPG